MLCPLTAVDGISNNIALSVSDNSIGGGPPPVPCASVLNVEAFDFTFFFHILPCLENKSKFNLVETNIRLFLSFGKIRFALVFKFETVVWLKLSVMLKKMKQYITVTSDIIPSFNLDYFILIITETLLPTTYNCRPCGLATVLYVNCLFIIKFGNTKIICNVFFYKFVDEWGTV